MFFVEMFFAASLIIYHCQSRRKAIHVVVLLGYCYCALTLFVAMSGVPDYWTAKQMLSAYWEHFCDPSGIACVGSPFLTLFAVSVGGGGASDSSDTGSRTGGGPMVNNDGTPLPYEGASFDINGNPFGGGHD